MAARPPLGFCGKLDNTGRDGAQARKVTKKDTVPRVLYERPNVIVAG
jgi:hypothetical protein